VSSAAYSRGEANSWTARNRARGLGLEAGPGPAVLRVPPNRLQVDPVRTDGERLLVFSDTGKRDVKEAYAYDIPAAGEPRPSPLRRA
jgi:hypothetical protein